MKLKFIRQAPFLSWPASCEMTLDEQVLQELGNKEAL